MKTQLEQIALPADSSFNIMVNPYLNDFFFWHFHPQYELVYIDGANGVRNVGKNVSKYEGSDLAFIGSNIPHLNFDYGVKTKYEIRVLHLDADFLSHALNKVPELQSVQVLFAKASHGIAFGERTKQLVGQKILALHEMEHFERFVEVLKIFKILGDAEDSFLLHDEPVRTQHTRKDQNRLKTVYTLIEAEYHRKIDIAEVADLSNLTNESFCRFFKRMTKLTFIEFLNHYRINMAKKLLMQDKNVTEVCFECGFESLSYFNRTFKKVTGENPLAYKRKVISV
ncbi:AraC family transcriptional regulator [Fulvivirga sp.]|uniref:AraC family transcriptional regulator n=1 Tax=Fulvivirga sp. TaxID=1931237 RepID=UPI0032EB579F